MRPKLFSFFAGAGFLDLGFEHSGYSVSFVNEYHRPFLEAYKFSRTILQIPAPKYGYSSHSITDFTSGEEARQLATKVEDARNSGCPIGFVGGPPCPDFSVGGKNRGRHGENGKLSATYVDLICEHKPDFFLFENVKGLWRTKRHRAFFEELKQKLHRSGYRTTERLINCLWYGVPQDRERIILLGFRDDDADVLDCSMELPERWFPWSKYQRYSPTRLASVKWPASEQFSTRRHKTRPVTVPEDITVEYWFGQNGVETHPNASHQFRPRAGLVRFKSVPEGDDSKKSFKRLHRWRYSPTACYGNNEVHLHPYKARRISVAEALAVQSLPAEFQLPQTMSLSNMFKTVGNGVPYLAARALAQSILDFMVEHRTGNRFDFPVSQVPPELAVAGVAADGQYVWAVQESTK